MRRVRPMTEDLFDLFFTQHGMQDAVHIIYFINHFHLPRGVIDRQGDQQDTDQGSYDENAQEFGLLFKDGVVDRVLQKLDIAQMSLIGAYKVLA